MTEMLKIGREDAEEYTEALTMGISALQFFAQFGADDLGIPDALGLSSEEWGRRVIGGGKVWRNPDERRQLSVHLTAPKHEGGAGLSNRQAAEVAGTSEATIRRDREAATNDAREPVDGENEQVTGAANTASATGDALDPGEPLWADDTMEPGGGSESSTPANEADGRNLTPADSDTQQAKTDPPPTPVNDGDEWYTPPWLFRSLGIEFSLDVCAPLDQTYLSVPADKHLTIEDDGLAQHYHKRKAEIAASGTITPYYVTQGYVTPDRSRLLGAAVARMADVIAAIDMDLGYPKANGDGTQFYVVPWSALTVIHTWHPDADQYELALEQP